MTLAEIDLENLRSRDSWFFSHYVSAVNELAEFLAGDGLSLEGRTVADIGCGDGILDLGITHQLRPAQLVGFDLRAVDVEQLRTRARNLIGVDVPSNLEFVECAERQLPAADDTFDYVITWSAFEHISDPVGVAREMHRIMRPDGLLFLQLFPFYYSEWGSHLEEWFAEPWVQHRLTPEQIVQHLHDHPLPGRPWWSEYMSQEFATLNRITLDELHVALNEGGFAVCKLEVCSNSIHIPLEVQHIPLSLLAINGVKLIARPL